MGSRTRFTGDRLLFGVKSQQKRRNCRSGEEAQPDAPEIETLVQQPSS